MIKFLKEYGPKSLGALITLVQHVFPIKLINRKGLKSSCEINLPIMSGKLSSNSMTHLEERGWEADKQKLSTDARLRKVGQVEKSTTSSNEPVRLLPGEIRDQIEKQWAVARDARGSATDSTEIHVVLACDDNYAPHAAVTIASAFYSSAKPSALKFHLLQDGNLSQTAKRRLSQTASDRGGVLEFVQVRPEVFAGLPLNRSHISKATYYRLGMHRALSGHISRVVYLDSDTIVTDDLSLLWNSDLNGHALGACPDEGGKTQAQRLGLNSEHRYFNAGVSVFDLEALRNMNFGAIAAQAFEDNRAAIELQDQDILNLVFHCAYQTLQLRWNVNSRIFSGSDLNPSYSPQEAIEAARAPGVLHFTDRRKPWMSDCLNSMAPLYWEFRNQTPWRETGLDGMKRAIHKQLRNGFSKSQRRMNAFYRDLSKAR